MLQGVPCDIQKRFRVFATLHVVAEITGKAGGRVVNSLSSKQEVRGSHPGASEGCLAVMELFVNIYLYEFILCLVCVC